MAASTYALWPWFLLCSVPSLAIAAEDVRENYDAAGNLTHQLRLKDEKVVQDISYRYEGGRLVEKVTVGEGNRSVETWTYEGGVLTVHALQVNGQSTLKESNRYTENRLVERITEVPEQPTKTTRWTYDGLGRVINIETRAADGSLISQTSSMWERPIVPIHFELSLGGAWSSQTEVMDLLGGFQVSRKPDASLEEIDPLEFKVGINYKLSRTKGETVNDELNAWFAMDYNSIVPKITLFFFSTLMRNPVANLNADLVIAPVGLKYTPLDNRKSLFDISFAPVWNYRSILAPAGGACDGVTVTIDTPCETSKVRGSFRVRAGYEGKVWRFADTVSYLPALDPEDFANGWGDGSILSNDLGISAKLNSRLSLNESVILTRDLSLSDQVDCSADPDNLLCKGLMFTTATTLSFAFDVAR